MTTKGERLIDFLSRRLNSKPYIQDTAKQYQVVGQIAFSVLYKISDEDFDQLVNQDNDDSWLQELWNRT